MQTLVYSFHFLHRPPIPSAPLTTSSTQENASVDAGPSLLAHLTRCGILTSVNVSVVAVLIVLLDTLKTKLHVHVHLAVLEYQMLDRYRYWILETICVKSTQTLDHVPLTVAAGFVHTRLSTAIKLQPNLLLNSSEYTDRFFHNKNI